jgi:hypothetical protein
MKRIAIALLFFVASIAAAESDVYQTGFNAHGYTFMQTDTMVAGDTATVLFITPLEAAAPHYLIQVSRGSDSSNIKHHAALYTIDGQFVAEQYGYAPSFYVKIGPQGLIGATYYLLQISNYDEHGNPTCHHGKACNVTVLIQPAN